MKKKLNDVNIPIKMKLVNVTKETFDSLSDHLKSSHLEFRGDIVLEVFGKKVKIGTVITDNIKNVPEITYAIKKKFLLEFDCIHFYVR